MFFLFVIVNWWANHGKSILTRTKSWSNHRFAALTWFHPHVSSMFSIILSIPIQLVPAWIVCQDSQGPPVNWLAVSLRTHVEWEHRVLLDFVEVSWAFHSHGKDPWIAGWFSGKIPSSKMDDDWGTPMTKRKSPRAPQVVGFIWAHFHFHGVFVLGKTGWRPERFGRPILWAGEKSHAALQRAQVAALALCSMISFAIESHNDRTSCLNVWSLHLQLGRTWTAKTTKITIRI